MKKILFFMLVLVIVITCVNTALAGEESLRVVPDRIDIGPGFNGAELTITGNAPEGSDIYIKVTSPDDSVLQLSKKGKVGLFWMNVENTVVTNVPKLYRVVSSAPFSRMPPALQGELGINPDFSGIYSGVQVVKHTDSGTVRLPDKDAGKYVEALIGIYKDNGLYGTGENTVQAGEGKFKAVVKLPPNIPQEKCTVTVYAVRDGKVVSTASAPFKVSGVGLVRWLGNEAIYNGPEYGFIAVLLALAFGAGIAQLFSLVENAMGGGEKTGLSHGAGH
ncbi:MAG: TIGR02186 family protein [Peptococcaceae bacterium]|nr:TIGR02186 family protein [Peptococcaceae bacterium]